MQITAIVFFVLVAGSDSITLRGAEVPRQLGKVQLIPQHSGAGEEVAATLLPKEAKHKHLPEVPAGGTPGAAGDGYGDGAPAANGITVPSKAEMTSGTNSTLQDGHELQTQLLRSDKEMNPVVDLSSSGQRERTPVVDASIWGIVIATIENSSLCPKEFPNLELHAGVEGDRCIAKQNRRWSCPVGCTYVGEDKAPFCLNAGTRDLCSIPAAETDKCEKQLTRDLAPAWHPRGPRFTSTKCPHLCPYPHPRLVKGGDGLPDSYHNMGDTCDDIFGFTTHWCAPKGCEVLGGSMKGRDSAPYTYLKGTVKVVKGVMTGEVCKADKIAAPPGQSVDIGIHGMWRLVASNTHGASVDIETGFSSAKSKSVTREEAHAFSTEMSQSYSATTAVEAWAFSAETTYERSSTSAEEHSASLSNTAESAVEQSKSQMVSVQCPDVTFETENTVDGIEVTSSFSQAMEYVYQWVVGNTEYEAKTQHFRCHQAADGIERPPQCQPQACGNPETNPYCGASDGVQLQYITGADPSCSTHLGFQAWPLGDGDCGNHYAAMGKVGVQKCAKLCVDDPHCNVFTYGDYLGCRFSKCGSDPGPNACPADKQCPSVPGYGGVKYKVKKV